MSIQNYLRTTKDENLIETTKMEMENEQKCPKLWSKAAVSNLRHSYKFISQEQVGISLHMDIK